jgi:hypothetical protein
MLNMHSLITIGVALACTACASATPPGGRPPIGPGADNTERAMPVGGLGQVGDTIYFVDIPVRADAREPFETFVQNTLWPAFQEYTTPAMPGPELIRRIRFLMPHAESDGAFTYTFILDPAVPGLSYNVLDILTQKYGEATARAHYDMWTAMWARDFTVRRFVQSR